MADEPSHDGGCLCGAVATRADFAVAHFAVVKGEITCSAPRRRPVYKTSQPTRPRIRFARPWHLA